MWYSRYAQWAVLALLPLCSAVLHGAEMTANGPPSHSLTFAGAADRAVAASAELRNAYAGQRLKEQAWLLGLRAYLPKLSLTASENDRLQEIGADSFLKNYGISLDQLLWDGGRTSMSRRLERMELNLSNAQLGRMAADIAESALSAYRNVLSSRAVLAIREAALESLVEQRRILAEEVARGMALPVDLAEAELTVAEARIEIVSLNAGLAETERQFAEALGLDLLPALAETVDITRPAVLPAADAARSLAGERNPDLAQARFAIIRGEGELQAASRSWIPSFRLNGSFGLSGQNYPLNRYTWSVGLNIEFSGPWLQNSFGAKAGWEPPYDRTAGVQNSLSPLPDPAASLTKHQAELALSLQREQYRIAVERVGRSARRAVEQCTLADRKRSLAVEAIGLAAERRRLEEVRLRLGQITRLDLMEAYITCAQREIAAVEAAVSLLEAERDLERLLDLNPGELAAFAAATKEDTK
jgi:outer membrane protein TolC